VDGVARSAEGAGLGAAIGGALAAFGAVAIPGVGILVGFGWLVPVLLCAAAGGVAGGVIGLLAGAGGDERDTRIFAEGVRRGGILLFARIHDDEAARAKAILRRCGAIDTDARRAEYAGDGWDGFVAKDIWDEDIGSEEQRLAEKRLDEDQPDEDRLRHIA
jgi:hypothetical protein